MQRESCSEDVEWVGGLLVARTTPADLFAHLFSVHIFCGHRFRVGGDPQSGRMAAKDELGRRGEDLAAEWLQAHGLRVLARNWRCSEGELDIVATDNERLVVCEVKTRSGERFGTPFEAVTQGKRRKLRRLGMLYLIDQREAIKGFPQVRFDVIGVMWRPGAEPTVEHRPEAF